jgi:phage terminase small subunit
MREKEHRFVEEYLVDLNGTQAAIRAGYSARSARSIAAENLTKPHIASAIAAALDARATRTGITQDRVLSELALLAFSDVTHYRVSDAGDVTLAVGAPPEAMRAVQSIKRRITTRGRGQQTEVVREIELRLWDKPGPLKLAGQHVGLFTEKVEHSGKVTLEQVLTASRETPGADDA